MRCPTLAELPPPPPERTGWPWTVDTPPVPSARPDGSPWPRISIVTPVFSAARTIESTMRSVIEQSYPNLEYIVMDGGSTDGTVRIIERYASHLTRWCTEPDGGQYNAIEKGFSQATGDIFCWINADDMFLPRSLWVVSEIFQHFPDIEWISTLKPGEWDANSYFTGTTHVQGSQKKRF